jgi:hypothetical protein
MKRSARVTVVTIVVGAILFGLARAVWSYAQVQSLALILTFLALLIAIGLDMLLVRLIGEVTTAGKARRKKMPHHAGANATGNANKFRHSQKFNIFFSTLSWRESSCT